VHLHPHSTKGTPTSSTPTTKPSHISSKPSLRSPSPTH
jgi:hypothetical protein